MMVQSRPVISYSVGAPVHDRQFVVTANHVTPPSILDVTLEFNAQRSVVPKAIQSTIDFAGLKHVATAFAKRNELFHLHHGSELFSGAGIG